MQPPISISAALDFSISVDSFQHSRSQSKHASMQADPALCGHLSSSTLSRYLSGVIVHMGNLTRTEVARMIQSKLLSGGKLTPKQLDRLLQKYGNHERSRVLEVLRCKWGIPITTDSKGCYSITESDLRRFSDDPDDVLSGWKENAKKNREYRQLYRFVTAFTGLTGISSETRREVLAAVKARI